MAHGLIEADRPRLHQALHGYADGHRQLASSVTLKPRDQKTLLALSDISGPGAPVDEDGYLTGYPLPDSGFFALSRTWPALEMPRPGCVWTHTLLIDFTDLASVEALSSLADLFKRPTGTCDFQDYGETKRLEACNQPGLPSTAEDWARSVVGALYGKPRSRIVIGRSGPGVDAAVLAIWSQQWPRLRRGFRFCTLAASDRSVEGAGFDLQVLPSLDRNFRNRFSEVVHAESIGLKDELWLEDALRDLLEPDSQGLRSFFRLLGSDVAIGREAFRPFCRLHRAVAAFSQAPEEIPNAIALLQDELGTKQARTARAIVAKAALHVVDKLDQSSFDFLWSNLGLLEPAALSAFAAHLGRETWRREPQRLAGLLDENAKTVLDRTLMELKTGELIAGLKAAPSLVQSALARRPEILQQSGFWSDIEAVDAPLKTALSQGMQYGVIAAMLESGRGDLAPAAVRTFGARITLEVLCNRSQDGSDRLGAWVRATTTDTSAVGEFLSSQPSIPRQFLHTLAQYLPPDAVPNVCGPDPWLVAWRNSTGTIEDLAGAYLAAYLLGRALGLSSRSQAELAQLSFEPAHAAAAIGRLSDDGWRILESRLPWSIFWLEWDRCQRIRAGITDLFVERDLSPSVFGQLTQNDQLFLLLANRAASSGRGRAYLRRVRRAMKDERETDLSFRNHQLKKMLGQW